MSARNVIGIALLCAVVGHRSWCAARRTPPPSKHSLSAVVEHGASRTGKTVAWSGRSSQRTVVVELKNLISNGFQEAVRGGEPALIQGAEARVSGSGAGA